MISRAVRCRCSRTGRAALRADIVQTQRRDAPILAGQMPRRRLESQTPSTSPHRLKWSAARSKSRRPVRAEDPPGGSTVPGLYPRHRRVRDGHGSGHRRNREHGLLGEMCPHWGANSWVPGNAGFQLRRPLLTAPLTPRRSSFTEYLDLHPQARIKFYTCWRYGR
jgi:hypothetical protein